MYVKMINKDNNLCLDKICRSCMLENKEMRSVYESNTDAVQLAEMIMACASVQVASDDGLPNLICPKCEEQLNIAYLFKQQCERTDTTLREYTNHALSSSIKEETESLDIVVKPDIDVLEIYDDADDARNNDDTFGSGSESVHSSYSASVGKKKKSPKTRQCRYCSKMLSTKEGLKLHERRHTGEKLKTCPVCHTTFTKSNHLIRHMQLHNKPTDEYKHTCQECGMGFMKATHLLKHKREHKKETADSGVGEPSALTDDGDEDEASAHVKNEVDSDDVGHADHNHDHVDDNRPKLRPKKEPPHDHHPCKVCNKLLTTVAGLHIHMRRHTGKNLSTCYICMKSFTKTSHLNRHMLTHGVTPVKSAAVPKEKSTEPKEKKYLACEFCDRKFVYRKSFLSHIQLEHQISEDSDTPLSEYATIVTKAKLSDENGSNGNNKDGAIDNGEDKTVIESEAGVSAAQGEQDNFEMMMLEQDEAKKVQHVCHVCNHKFTRANHLTRHMTLHRAVLLHKCERCEKAFMTAEYLAAHVQEYHVDRPYVCSLCNKPFSRGEHLIRHLKVHDKDAPAGKDDLHKCSICEKTFSRSDHLARHTKLHLAQDKRHVCGECGKAFNRLDNLRTHARIHTGVRDPQRLHLCIYCGKEFNNSSNMIVHMRRHTGERPYKCAQCGKGFPRSHDLKCHERTHSGEKPYLCTLCGKSFNKSNKLLRHTRVHTGERPYVCSLCGRAFTQSNDLALHMRRHTGSRPYACGMCPARFIQSGQLKAHRRSQGHWLETPPELKGAHRVTPVTPLVNPPPIKFKTRVQRIKEEPTILGLGHTIGLSAVAAQVAAAQAAAEAVAKQRQLDGVMAADSTGSVSASGAGPLPLPLPPPSFAAFIHNKSPQNEQQVHNFSVSNRNAVVVLSSSGVHMSAGDQSQQQQQQQQQQQSQSASSGGASFHENVEPSTSFANTFTVSSEGYSYQSYG